MKFDKSIVLLYQDNPTVVEDMQDACIKYCRSDGDDIPNRACILQRIHSKDDNDGQIILSAGSK